MRITRQKRSGITPIIVEFMLIAIVLIACVMLAGFTFGLFSSYVTPAEVAVESAICSTAGNTTTCQLTLTNVGARDTSTTGTCSMSAGADENGSVVGGGTVPAGGSLSGVECVAHGYLSTGSQVSGALSLTNGGIAFFVGTLEQ